MRKILILISLVMPALVCNAQQTSLNETFNTGCPTGISDPNGWKTYNVIPGTEAGSWKCNASSGRGGTPCVTCSGLFGSPLTYHLDTSILVSPPLDLTSYATIYVNFDTKITNFNLGAKMEVVISQDSTMGSDTSIHLPLYTLTASTDLMTPPFSAADASDWVTHTANLTTQKNVVPLYIGFRYTSADGTNGSRWYLDNVITTTIPYVAVSDINAEPQAFHFTGSANAGTLSLSCYTPEGGNYTLSVYDMTGRMVHTQPIRLQTGKSHQTVDGHTFASGMYILKLGNENLLSTAKVYMW